MHISSERLAFLDDAVERPPDDETVASKEARGWGTNDSSFEDYHLDVNLPHHLGGLLEVVRNHVATKSDRVGLDLAGGSNGVALQDLLAMDVLDRALLTNYADLRSEATIRNAALEHIAGDLTERDTWEDILDWQSGHAPDGFALIMHRPVGGLQFLAPETYQKAAHLLLDMTQPGGVLFTQVPKSLNMPGADTEELDAVCDSLSERDDLSGHIPSYVYRGDRGRIMDYVILAKKP